MVVILEVAAVLVLGFFSLYLALLSVLAALARPKRRYTGRGKTSFAVVIPAHDEELVLAKTLSSLYAIDYDRTKFDVVVVADNCSDGTAAIAEVTGAIVLERKDAVRRGKGYALRYCFDVLLRQSRKYDAFVVVDADSVVSPNFLRVMDEYLSDGAKVVQASDLVQSRPGAWSSEVTRIGLLLYNYIRPLGRKVVGCAAGLRGNGMCFSADVLKDHPWDAFSLTEDLEYGLKLLLDGYQTVFAPETAVYASMPASAKNAESQRARWEGGRFAVVRNYTGRLLSAAWKKRSLICLDACVDLVMPAFVNMVVLSAILLAVTLVLTAFGIINSLVFVLLWFGVLALEILHVGIGMWIAKVDRSAVRAILYLPRYAAWKIGIYLKLMVRGRPERWVRTTRESVQPRAVLKDRK